MIALPFTNRWFVRSVMEALNKLHVGSCDLFPHEGLLTIGGTKAFGGSRLTVVLHALVSQVIDQVPRCGWPDTFVREFVDLCRLADAFLRHIDEASVKNSPTADAAGRYFYLACGCAWHVAALHSGNHGVRHEGTLDPFGDLLKHSGVGDQWHPTSLGDTNAMLRNRMDELTAQLREHEAPEGSI